MTVMDWISNKEFNFLLQKLKRKYSIIWASKVFKNLQTKMWHSLFTYEGGLSSFGCPSLNLHNLHCSTSYHVKSRLFKNRELYWSSLPQNSNFWRESFVQKSEVQIPVEEGKFFCHFSFFFFLFVHKKLNIKT